MKSQTTTMMMMIISIIIIIILDGGDLTKQVHPATQYFTCKLALLHHKPLKLNIDDIAVIIIFAFIIFFHVSLIISIFFSSVCDTVLLG